MPQQMICDYGESKRSYCPGRPQYKLAMELFRELSTQCLPQDAKILDIGCGKGEFEEFLAKSGFKAICVDGVDMFVEEMSKKGYECYEIDLEKQALPFGANEFDFIFSLDVIEHLWNTQFFLSEIKRVLKPDGTLVITTENYNYWYYRLKHLKGNFEYFTYGSRHKKFYTFKSFTQEIRNMLTVKKIAGYSPIFKKVIKEARILDLCAKTIGITCGIKTI